jgi:phosphatidylglycerophosphatase A
MWNNRVESGNTMTQTHKWKTLPALAKKIGWFYTLLSTGCLSGYAPVAPGTLGTAVAILPYLLLMQIGGLLKSGWMGWSIYIVVTVLVFVFGVQGADRVEAATQQKDGGIIVIDEIVGYLVTMFLVPQEWLLVIIGFFVFRFFDIAKPYPIRKLDKNPNLKGFGVMIDDVLAGVYSNIVMQILVVVMRRYV